MRMLTDTFTILACSKTQGSQVCLRAQDQDTIIEQSSTLIEHSVETLNNMLVP